MVVRGGDQLAGSPSRQALALGAPSRRFSVDNRITRRAASRIKRTQLSDRLHNALASQPRLAPDAYRLLLMIPRRLPRSIQVIDADQA